MWGGCEFTRTSEAFFGRDVLVQCTPKGARGRPSLPVRELADLKLANGQPVGAIQKSLKLQSA